MSGHDPMGVTHKASDNHRHRYRGKNITLEEPNPQMGPLANFAVWEQ